METTAKRRGGKPKSPERARLERIKALEHEMWYRGDLSFLSRPHGQRRLYDFVHGWKQREPDELTHLVLNCHRRLGKSFALLLFLVERAIRYPGQILKYAAPTAIQVNDIVRPNLHVILETCPSPLRPRRSGNEYYFYNPRWKGVASDAHSMLKLVGCNVAQGDRLRGQACDAAAVDESRDFEYLEYVLTSVLSMQFIGRYLPLLLQASTPPRSMSHEFASVYIPRAMEENKYLCIPGSQNRDFGPRDQRIVEKEVGGRDTVAWRREVECELISDDASLIVPEFQDSEPVIVVKEYERPDFFQPYACIDTGWTDNTSIVYGYIDFEEQLFVVEDGLWTHYAHTGAIAQSIRDLEAKLYPEKLLQKMRKRIIRHGDMTPQQLNDFRIDQKILFRPVDKHDREGRIARFRTSVQQCKLRIIDNDGNQPLIFQMRHGVWNQKRTDFERGDGLMGHCDALASLTYLWRCLGWRSNPFPKKQADYRTQHIPLEVWKKQQKNQGNVRSAFDVR